MNRSWVLAIFLLAACSGPSKTSHVRGRVVDELGRPVPDAKVDVGVFPSHPDEWDMSEALACDAEGKFEGEIEVPGRMTVPLLALDGRGRGGMAFSGKRREPVTIVMTPLSRVSARLSFEKLSLSIARWQAEMREGNRPSVHLVATIGGEPRIVRIDPLEDGRFEYWLPVGEYSLQFHGLFQPITRSFRVGDPAAPVDLGVLEALPLKYHELIDAPAPELQVVDAKNGPAGLKLSDLRGKWVFLLFWDRRIKEDRGLRQLVRFHNDPPVDRNGFAIIAIHNSDDVISIAELEHARAFDTDGRRPEPIPFPIALDDHGKTFAAYGIEPGATRQSLHLILVNPEGRIELTKHLSALDYVTRKLQPQ